MKCYMRLFSVIATLLIVQGCGGAAKNKEWDDIDYSKVARQNRREYDNTYVPPTVTGCTDDDLYNCNPR